VVELLRPDRLVDLSAVAPTFNYGYLAAGMAGRQRLRQVTAATVQSSNSRSSTPSATTYANLVRHVDSWRRRSRLMCHFLPRRDAQSRGRSLIH
jgi:hypothetical protein